tara:strand:+ start:265 stop:1446 length:1182 start_codon:yes stop_codon:yes gene_type:complete
MESEEDKKEIVLSPKYKPLWQSDKRYFICTGGRGSGKSFSVTLFLLTLTFEEGHRILFTRYTLTSAKTSIIPQFIEVMEALGYDDSIFDINNDVITNKQTGSQIIFKGIKTGSKLQTASLKSLTGITTFVVDEAEELTEEDVFNKIDYSVRVKGVKNRVILIMNPTTRDNWIYDRWFVNTKNNTTYIHTTYLDNIDNLNEDIIDEFNYLKESKPKEYEHIVLGGWKHKADGVIFENWETGTFDESLPFMFGVDWGFASDPSTLVKVAINNKTKTLYLQECLYAHKQSTEQLTEHFKIVCGESMIVADNSELRLINEIRREGVNIYPVVKKPNSILAGIKKMQGYNMVICGESSNLIKELNNYAWIDKGTKTVPIDDHNHILDAVRYSLTRLIP